MPEIKKITDHITQGLSRLISQYKERYYINQLVKSLLTEKQILEDNIYQVLNSVFIENADSARLDVLGKIVGLSRGDFSDSTYRLLIRGKIAQNISGGKTQDVFNLLSVIDPTAEYTEVYPATIRINSGLDFSDPDLIAAYVNLIVNAKPAGVSFEIFDTSFISGNIFRTTHTYDTIVNAWDGSFSDVNDSNGQWIPTANSGVLIAILKN